MALQPKRIWPWRDFLTPEERIAVLRAEEALAESRRLNIERQRIANRATHRAMHAAKRAALSRQGDGHD